MTADAETREGHKRAAAERAVGYVRSGMVVGLGGGSTAAYATQHIGRLLREGKLEGVRGVPCSGTVAALAREHGVPLTTLERDPVIDLTIDGADEVDPHLNLIKGGGGALLHEKIVGQASRREVIVVDELKLSPALGTRWAVPVEVVPFGWGAQVPFLEGLGARVALRPVGPKGGTPGGAPPDAPPFRTDEGNLILDCRFGPLADPQRLADLAARLAARAGVVEHGLFLGMTDELIVAGTDGVRHVSREGP